MINFILNMQILKKEIQHYNLDYKFYNFVTYLKIMN